ncbi:MAG TPA: FumA C-terminus/TtdB family hydratase beta subunit [Feifaniaceae bacterium]|nr:FumA C-terminus/TtdB family hydratase beta subunit [Feifaniaceae bacterium]
MEAIRVELPLSKEAISTLRAGDVVALYGTAYTARDAAHKRLHAMMEAGEELPIPLEGACIYYAGPCPAAPGEVIGPCGPTTSGRVDAYTPALIGRGMTAMIGKGKRSADVKEAMRGRAVYFAATGGAGMLIARHIVKAEPVAFAELGAEAILKLMFDGVPAIVAIDALENDLFER